MSAKSQLYPIFLLLFMVSASFSMSSVDVESVEEEFSLDNSFDDTPEGFCQRYGKSLEEVNMAYQYAPLDAKDIVDKIIRPNKYPKGFYRSSIFLGEPGVGKTTLLIAVALKLWEIDNWNFEFFTHSDFDGSERNTTGINLKNRLNIIIKSKEKTLVAIDELHKLLENSDDKHYDTGNTSSTLWTFLDYQKFNQNFFFIGCMNEGDNMAEPMKDRMYTNYVRLPRPTSEMKRAIFRSKLINALTRLHDDCNDQVFDMLLEQLINTSGRNIEGFVQKAFDLARRDDRDSDVITINREHFELATLNGRDNVFKCGQKQEPEAERLHRESLNHNERLHRENLDSNARFHQENLDKQDANIAQQAWMQLKTKSLDRSTQDNIGINGGVTFGLNGGGNIGMNLNHGSTRHVVLASDYEAIKEGLTNNQVRHLESILLEAQVRIVTAQTQRNNPRQINQEQTNVQANNHQNNIQQVNQTNKKNSQSNEHETGETILSCIAAVGTVTAVAGPIGGGVMVAIMTYGVIADEIDKGDKGRCSIQ